MKKRKRMKKQLEAEGAGRRETGRAAGAVA